MNDAIELGVDTFGDVTVSEDGQQLSQAQTLRNVVEQGVLADQVGLHFIGLGEHHRPDFAISAPEVIAAAIAARTSRIRIGTAVTVLSTDDPVRVFQRFSTINAISNGRAEVIVGRGSFTESFPLFGYDLSLYEQLFEEKLNLWVELLKGEPVSWNGRLRSGLHEQKIYPPSESGTLTTWVAVGKSGIGGPGRVLRTAVDARHHRRDPARFRPWVDLPRAIAAVRKPARPVGVHPGSHCRNGRTGQEELFPHHVAMMNRIGAERGYAQRPARVRARRRTRWCALRRFARNRGREDRRHREDPGPHAIRSEIQQRHPSARTADEEHRAYDEGGAEGERDTG